MNFIYAFKCYEQIAINVSWPHFSWPTLYVGPIVAKRFVYIEQKLLLAVYYEL